MATSVDPDGTAHNEPSHQDLVDASLNLNSSSSSSLSGSILFRNVSVLACMRIVLNCKTIIFTMIFIMFVINHITSFFLVE